MRRSVIAALLALVVAPVSVQAQVPGQDLATRRPWPRVSVTPFMGFRLGFDREIEQVIVTDGVFDGGEAFLISQNLVDEEAVTVPGIEVDLRVAGPISLVGSVVYDPGGRGILRVLTEQTSQVLAVESPESLLGKVGVGIWLREPNSELRIRYPNAQIFVGAAVRDANGLDFPPAGSPTGDDDISEDARSWGVNFGFKGETPIWRDRLVFQFGMEDYWTFWDDLVAERHIERVLTDAGETVRVDVESQSTHLFMLRAGVSLQF